MHHAAAITALLAAATLTQAQARYEIGYQFDDEPEVVQVEGEPFSVSGEWLPREGRARQGVIVDQTQVFARSPTLNSIWGQSIGKPDPAIAVSQRAGQRFRSTT